MTLVPIAAWMMTSKSWRGISSLSLSAILRPQSYDLSRWMITENASTGSPLISMSSLHEIALAIFEHLVVETGVPAADRLEPVVEVEDDLGQRELEVELDPLRCRCSSCSCRRRAARWTSVMIGPMYSAGATMRAFTNGSSTSLDLGGRRHAARDSRAASWRRRGGTPCTRRSGPW